MIKMIEGRTADLIGPALDWAVAKALGLAVFTLPKDNPEEKWQVQRRLHTGGPFWPSQDWSQGGPLIEQHGIEVFCNLSAEQASRFKDASPDWRACMNRGRSEHSHGPTPLIAAMRCLVAAKLGDMVQVPAELLAE